MNPMLYSRKDEGRRKGRKIKWTYEKIIGVQFAECPTRSLEKIVPRKCTENDELHESDCGYGGIWIDELESV